MQIRAWLRRWWPWLTGLAIVIVVALRFPLADFSDAMNRGHHLALAAVDLAVTASVLASDSLSTWIGLYALRERRPLPAVLAVRGATYLLFLINYALGQGGFGYYLHRTGTPTARAVGVTLFLIGTNLAMLLIVTTVAWAQYGPDADRTLWWTLCAGCAALGAYLVVIAIAPRVLAERAVLRPLFDGGVGAHALAMIGRAPHVAVMVIGQWAALRAWGLDVPFTTGIAILPVVVIASVLPISPAGLGTTQAAIVYFFAAYAPGATEKARGAYAFAFGAAHFVYGLAASLLVGVICVPFARRIGALPPSATPAATPAP